MLCLDMSRHNSNTARIHVKHDFLQKEKTGNLMSV